ncbi:MAG: hypothetical protein QOK28_1874 [Actinomycetota bacterium]
MTFLRSVVRTVQLLFRAREHRFDLVRELSRRPGLLVATGASEFGVMVSNCVPEQLKLLAEFRAASIVGCEFCMDIGSAIAELTALDPRQITELDQFETSDAFSPRERAVVRFATVLSQRTAEVSPELRAELASYFSRAQIVELAYTIAHENERARFYIGIDLPPSRFASDGACRVRPSVSA